MSYDDLCAFYYDRETIDDRLRIWLHDGNGGYAYDGKPLTEAQLNEIADTMMKSAHLDSLETELYDVFHEHLMGWVAHVVREGDGHADV